MASVLVAGATGAIGRTVVQHAIRHSSIQRVVALTRSANVTEANYPELFGVVTHLEATEEDHKQVQKAHPADTVVVTPLEAAKIKPVTLDWEAFTTDWTALRTNSDFSTDLANKYQEIFSGHTYAAMCLGTTRKDAGSAKQFTRCDYDYFIAFTEAVLAFSAPAGLDVQATFMHSINDGGEVKKGMVAVPAEAATTEAATSPFKSTATLRAFCQVSAGVANSDSWLLYVRTKGNADEATVERIHHHNKKSTAAPVLLFLLRPGLLDRHEKSRWNEKLAKAILPSIPVETCGAAVVGAFVDSTLHQTITEDAPRSSAEQSQLDAKGQKMTRKGEDVALLGNRFRSTKTMKKAGVPSEEDFAHVYELTDVTIKKQAARLNAAKPAAGETL